MATQVQCVTIATVQMFCNSCYTNERKLLPTVTFFIINWKISKFKRAYLYALFANTNSLVLLSQPECFTGIDFISYILFTKRILEIKHLLSNNNSKSKQNFKTKYFVPYQIFMLLFLGFYFFLLLKYVKSACSFQKRCMSNNNTTASTA